ASGGEAGSIDRKWIEALCSRRNACQENLEDSEKSVSRPGVARFRARAFRVQVRVWSGSSVPGLGCPVLGVRSWVSGLGRSGADFHQSPQPKAHDRTPAVTFPEIPVRLSSPTGRVRVV